MRRAATSEAKALASLRNLALANAANAQREYGTWACARCGKEDKATVHQLRHTYCSKECMASAYAERMAGSANPNFSDAGRKTCAHCGSVFHNYSKASKFCSGACYHESRTLPAKPAKPARVKKEHPVKPPRVSRSAQSECINCGKQFSYYLSRPKFCCSYACHLATGGAFRAGMAAAKATMKYGARKDANHGEVIDAMRELCAVYDLSDFGRGIPDGIAWVQDQWRLFDVKNPKTYYGRKGVNAVQKKWINQWQGGPVFLIYTADEARRFARGELDGIKRAERVEVA